MKKKKIKSAKQKEQSQKGPTKNFFIGIVRKNYFPYLVIIVLAFLYFAPGLFSSTSMYTTDGALQGNGSKGASFDFEDLINPFEYPQSKGKQIRNQKSEIRGNQPPKSSP